MMQIKPKIRDIFSLIFMIVATLAIILGYLISRDDVIPAHWNPMQPLEINAPLSPFTKMKLRRASADKTQCIAALETAGVNIATLDDFTSPDNPKCGIQNHIELRALNGVGIDPIRLDCQLALRLAMWIEHDVQPLSRKNLQSPITQINHIGGYNCRAIRSSNGNSNRMSQHATANAIDISGFGLADERKISLIHDWDDPDYQRFLKPANKSACRWFHGVLGPEYNSLHADHFHLDMTPKRRFCR